jgi:hypothetical protein
VKHGFRIISSYAVGRAGERVWILTKADRSSTCILLPEEYRAGKMAPRRPGRHLPTKRRVAGRLRDVRRAASQALLRTPALHVVDRRHVD